MTDPTWAPAVVIRLPLEGRPWLTVEARDEADRARIVDWVEGNPELRQLVQRAHELAKEVKA